MGFRHGIQNASAACDNGPMDHLALPSNVRSRTVAA